MMEFLKEHCSGTDATDPDKKTKKRRRKNEVTHLSGSKPLKKMKLDGTSLEIHGEEEDSGAKYEENITKYSECDLDDNNNECANNEKGRFPKNKASLEPSERVNDVPKNFVGAAPTEVQILSNEQALSKTPFAKVVSTVEGDRTDMKTSGKKNASITKKKMTSKTDRKEKFCGIFLESLFSFMHLWLICVVLFAYLHVEKELRNTYAPVAQFVLHCLHIYMLRKHLLKKIQYS
jgi:hypothetical protein